MTADARVDAELIGVFRVRDEGEIAGARLLNAGDADDVHLAVSLEATLQPVRDFP